MGIRNPFPLEPRTLPEAIISVRWHLEILPADERVKVFEGIMENYCPHCGCDIVKVQCHCQNDE